MAKNPHVSISLTGLAMAVFLFSSSLQAAQGGAEKKKEVSEYYYDVPVRRLVYRPAGGGDEHGGSVRAVRAVHGVPVLRVVEREQLRGRSVLLRHRLQHPRQALRRLRLLPPHLRLRRHQLHQPPAMTDTS
uniref:Uncharacterized protein n=1 Tax=Oryza brachyantha TaxID=4533 RepID=J3NAX0_ORYBR